MFKYIWQTYKPLLTIILIDLIVLISILIISLVTGLQEQFINYHYLPDAFELDIITLIFFLVYQTVILIQFPFALGVTAYTLTASRYTNCLKVIGKSKTIGIQAVLLSISLGVGILMSYSQGYILSPFNLLNYGYSIGVIWIIFVIGLFCYHLIFFSNIKYSNGIEKIAILLFTGLIGGALVNLNSNLYRILNYLNYWNFPTLTSSLNAIDQITIPPISPNTTIIFYILSYTLVITLISFVELKKVGR